MLTYYAFFSLITTTGHSNLYRLGPGGVRQQSGSEPCVCHSEGLRKARWNGRHVKASKVVG